MKLSVIIVTFNSERVIHNCIDTLLQSLKNFEKEIIVVDNASSDKTRETLISNYPKVKLITSDQNLGFGKAINLGVLGGVRGVREIGDVVVVLNPDVLLESDVGKVLEFMGNTEDVGVVGIKLLTGESREVQPYICGFRQTFFRLLRENFGMGEKPWQSIKPIEVDWVTGAAMFIRKEVFADIGGFDEKIFLFFEDQDFCIRAKQEGWRIIYYPLIAGVHKHGQSSNESENKMKKFYFKSQDYFFLKHNGLFPSLLVKILRKLRYFGKY